MKGEGLEQVNAASESGWIMKLITEASSLGRNTDKEALVLKSPCGYHGMRWCRRRETEKLAYKWQW